MRPSSTPAATAALCLLSLLVIRPVVAAAPDPGIKASLISETRGFSPGQALTVALRLEQGPGWHTYWRDPGDAGLATEVTWTLPAGVKVGPLLWPKPHVFKDPGGLVGYGYLDQALILARVSVPKDFKGERLSLKAQANWLACSDVCIPGNAGVSLVLARLDPNPASSSAPFIDAVRPSLGLLPEGYKGPVAPQPQETRVTDGQLGGFEQPAPAPAAAPAAAGPSLLGIVLLALLGGLLLNLMPCVLPVLSLKALSFVEQARESRAQGLALAGAFTAGVLACFWALAGVVLALKQGGAAVGWGFQFQEPAFVLGMAALVLAFSLNLFGVFEIWLPGGAMQGLSQASKKQGLAGAFGHGLVMTLLATPCTAPFLGTALGFAFAAPAYVLVLVFTAVGLGLALPYGLLAALPSSHAWLPKPGAWMLRFKEFMGFLLMATVVWLLWLLGKQVGVDAQAWGLTWLLLVALGAWAWGHLGSPIHSNARRRGAALALVALLGFSGAWIWPKVLRGEAGAQRADGGAWAVWDDAQVQALHAAGKPVFVDFGAEWCWTCKVNERGSLADDAVLKAFADRGVALFKADWTRRDPAITAALQSHGRSGVPMYVYYAPGQDPVVLPELLTPGTVLKAIGAP
jgi:thiol:disulfide interchange protein DsbD